jgi:hypothetical protein
MRSGLSSIAVLMIFILIIALDCAMLRYPLGGRPLREILLVIGVLPVANILAVGMLVLVRRGVAANRGRWLAGFLGGAWASMIAVIALATHSPDALASLVRDVATPALPLGVPVFRAVALVVLLAPQLVLAWIGGELADRYGRNMSRPATARHAGA